MSESLKEIKQNQQQQQLWTVTEIKPISPFHPPINSKCITFLQENPSVITNRIEHCLRDLSIVAEYDNSEAKACGVTKEYVRFVVELYRGSNGIIVECIRIGGDTRIFSRVCKVILNSAKGAEKKLGYLPQHSSSKPMAVSPQENSTAELGLEICLSLLKKDRLDANLLGMESLLYLTDTLISSTQTSIFASYAVLGIDPEEMEDFVRFMDINCFIVSLICDSKFSNSLTVNDSTLIFSDEENEEEEEDPFNDNAEHLSKLKSLAYQILLNALKVITSKTSLHKTAFQNIHQLKASILAGIKVDEDYMGLHDVALCVQILYLLIKQESDVITEAERKYVHDCIVNVYKVGFARHRLLACYSEELLLFLESD